MATQKQLPNMPAPLDDSMVLDLPSTIMKWIQDFCDGKIEFHTVGDIDNTYLNIVATLVAVKYWEPLVLKTMARYLEASAKAYVSYLELIARKG